jgi:hypothetical protein
MPEWPNTLWLEVKGNSCSTWGRDETMTRPKVGAVSQRGEVGIATHPPKYANPPICRSGTNR